MAQSNGQNGLPNNLSFPEDNGDPAQGKRKVNGTSAVHLNDLANGQLADNEDVTDPIVEELNAVRLREITTKAISGVLLMLLKWFKLSRESSRFMGIWYSAKIKLPIRYPKIRVPDPAPPRRKLFTFNPQALRPPRHR